tara:strand:- start:1035 stop:2624 length:1590 start_codon:yes stop_codon:yes gene_type:complete
MSETKWKSQLFSEPNTKNNNNILTFNMKNRIKKVKNKIDNIEPFETIYDTKKNNENENENENVTVEDDNLKEGMFTRDEFTGYDWDDPTGTSGRKGLAGSLADFIQTIYDYSVFIVTYTTDKVVEGSGGSRKNLKHNKKIVRKYVGLFYCLPLALFSAYNWYYITTFRNVVDNERTLPAKYLTQRKNKDGTKRGLSDDLRDLCEKPSFSGLVGCVVYFFFEYVVKIFDEFNSVFLDWLPELISKQLGTTVTFICLFLFLLNLFYYSAEVVKDMFISILTGKGFGIASSLLLVYIIIKIIGTMLPISNPNEHYFSDWIWLGQTFSTSGIMGGLVLGFFLVINLLRAFVVGTITVFWVPIFIGMSILCYSFLSIPLFADKFSRAFTEIDEECVKDYKVKHSSVCNPYTLWDWIVFFISTMVKSFYDTLFASSNILVFLAAITDYSMNIKGQTIKSNLIAYTSVFLVFALAVWFHKFSKTVSNNLKDAGVYEKKDKTFMFDEKQITGQDLLSKINKDVEQLNKTSESINNLF